MDVSTLERLLALAANSVARTAREEAVDAIGPTPTPDQQGQLAEIDAWLAARHARPSASRAAALPWRPCRRSERLAGAAPRS